jgi:hypothetical protein
MACAEPTDVPPNFITSVFGVFTFIGSPCLPVAPAAALGSDIMDNKSAPRFRGALMYGYAVDRQTLSQHQNPTDKPGGGCSGHCHCVRCRVHNGRIYITVKRFRQERFF